jgi:hypothetical protein
MIPLDVKKMQSLEAAGVSVVRDLRQSGLVEGYTAHQLIGTNRRWEGPLGACGELHADGFERDCDSNGATPS